ncbi:MAG: ABC transporter ATP-binding protein [Rhodospirillales bacterium]|nr:ABC transporter ATP-binding protein [Rhodospirillales bacterium]
MTASPQKPLPDKVFPFMVSFLERRTGAYLGLLFLSSALESFTLVAFSSVIKAFVDRADGLGTAAQLTDFYDLFGISAALLMLYAILIVLNFLGWRKGKLPYELNLREKLFQFTQRQSQRYFEDRLSGDISYRILDIPQSAIWVFAHLNYSIIPSVGALLFAVFWMAQISGVMALITLAWVILFLAITFVFVQACVAANRERSRAKGQVSGAIVDSIANNPVVRLFSAGRHEKSYVSERIERERSFTLKYYDIDVVMAFVHKLLLGAFFMVILVYAINLYSQGQLTIGGLSMAGSILLMVFLRAGGLGQALIMITESIGSIQSGIELLNGRMEVADQPGAVDMYVPEGRVTFSRVSFRYNDTQSRPVLQDLSLDIPPRQKVGLVGLSGVGKTTIVSLLLRMYDVQEGVIEIDGRNIAAVTQESLRRNIAVIPQDTSLFHRSLMDNIRYGRMEASDEDVMAAAQKAHAHEFITALPDGYETLVGERGVKLSGGQRQRIAIARAILKDAPILILDEATSALDSESEKLIQESLKDLMAGKTVIAIAHRLSTIAHLDRLIVMEDGKIVEDGPHKALLKQKGLYAKLWEMQSGGFIGG